MAAGGQGGALRRPGPEAARREAEDQVQGVDRCRPRLGGQGLAVGEAGEEGLLLEVHLIRRQLNFS